MREIVLDTETTGLDPKSGDRIVEVGCLELINHVPTQSTFHRYVNPERDMPTEAFNVHGLSEEFLRGHQKFHEIADGFLDFIGNDPLIIHNAEFDLRFLNAELARLQKPPIPSDRSVDTVRMARRRYPGAQASLDALCRRFGIDNSRRSKHGALLDAELLAEVYLELIGGRQPGLTFAQQSGEADTTIERQARPPRPHRASDAEMEAHDAFLEKLNDPIWRR